MIGMVAVLCIRPIGVRSVPGGAMWLSYLKDHYGDLASVVGLLVTFVGFIATIWNVRKTKQAAEEARQAAREAVSRIGTQILINEIGITLELVRQIDTACRETNWVGAMIRCDDSRARLAHLLENQGLEEQERALINLVFQDFGSILQDLQKCQAPSPPKRVQQSIGKRLHKVIEILGRIKTRHQNKFMEI